jgi:hypothetical protein
MKQLHNLPSLKSLKQEKCCQVLVTYACNPSYSGGRDQEDCGSKPAWANSETPSQKYLKQKRAGRVAEV